MRTTFEEDHFRQAGAEKGEASAIKRSLGSRLIALGRRVNSLGNQMDARGEAGEGVVFEEGLLANVLAEWRAGGEGGGVRSVAETRVAPERNGGTVSASQLAAEKRGGGSTHHGASRQERT